jgi:hypothetical protein
MERIETLQDTIAIWDKQIDEENMIAFIRVHANTNYNKGWDTIVECWSDGDILEYLSEAKFDMKKTIKAIQAWIDLRKEMNDNCQF